MIPLTGWRVCLAIILATWLPLPVADAAGRWLLPPLERK